MKNLQLKFIALFSVLIIFSGCKKTEEEKYFLSQNSTSISGKVFNQNNEPLSGVTVKINGKSTISDSEGAYEISNLATSNSKLTIQYSKDGFISLTRTVTIAQSINVSVALISLSSDIVSQTSFSAVEGTTITSTGSYVILPANNYKDINGNQYTGTVKAQVIYINPDNNNFSQLIDGSSYLTDEYGQYLESFGVLRVELYDASGNEIIYNADSSYNKSSGAYVGIAIPQSKMSSAPQYITLYSYNSTKSAYVASGTASKSGGQYVGTVSHFSSWTCAIQGSPQSMGNAQYTIDGGIYSNQILSNFNTFYGVIYNDTTGFDTYISVSGTDGDLYFILRNVQSVGTYQISSINLAFLTPPASPQLTLQNGSITVTRFDSVGGFIEGTFYGTASDTSGTYNISNGSFSVIRSADQ